MVSSEKKISFIDQNIGTLADNGEHNDDIKLIDNNKDLGIFQRSIANQLIKLDQGHSKAKPKGSHVDNNDSWKNKTVDFSKHHVIVSRGLKIKEVSVKNNAYFITYDHDAYTRDNEYSLVLVNKAASSVEDEYSDDFDGPRGMIEQRLVNDNFEPRGIIEQRPINDNFRPKGIIEQRPINDNFEQPISFKKNRGIIEQRPVNINMKNPNFRGGDNDCEDCDDEIDFDPMIDDDEEEQNVKVKKITPNQNSKKQELVTKKRK